VGILIVVGLSISVGDHHICFQSGPCDGRLQTEVSIPTIAEASEFQFQDFGRTTIVDVPDPPTYRPVLQQSLRAPPSI
jgi:hypothetical protein